MTLQRICIQLLAALLIIMSHPGAQSEASPSQSPCSDEHHDVLKAKCLELIFDWRQAHDGALPKATDFGFEPGQIPVKYERLTSIGHYAPEPTGSRGIFPSIQHVWLAFKEYARSRGVEVKLISLQFRVELLPEMRQIYQQEANQLVLSWVIEHEGRTPEEKDFGKQDGQIPINYQRMLGRGVYTAGARAARAAVFTSPQEFWPQFRDYAFSQGVAISLLQVTFKDALSDSLHALLQNEALELTLDWARRHGGLLPTSSNFGFGPDQIPIYYERLISIGSYSPQRRGHAAIFANGSEFWQRFHEYAREQGVSLRPKESTKAPVKVPKPAKALKPAEAPKPEKFKNEPCRSREKQGGNPKPKLNGSPSPAQPAKALSPDSALQSALRDRACQMVLDWNHQIGMRRFPRPEHFGPAENQIHFNYEQLVSQGVYSRGQPLAHEGLFEDEQQFGQWLKTYAEKQGVEFKLIHMPFAGERSEEIQKAIQLEALNLIVDWIRAQGRGLSLVPGPGEFTSHGGPIRLNYNRLTGTGLYLFEPRSRSRIFASAQEFEAALKKHVALLRRAPPTNCHDLLGTEVND